MVINGQPALEHLKIEALKRAMRSRLGLRLARAALSRQAAYKPHDQVASGFFLDLAGRAYADRHTRVVWTNVFVPSELLWGLGLTPFYPETWASLAAALGLSRLEIGRASCRERV